MNDSLSKIGNKENDAKPKEEAAKRLSEPIYPTTQHQRPVLKEISSFAVADSRSPQKELLQELLFVGVDVNATFDQFLSPTGNRDPLSSTVADFETDNLSQTESYFNAADGTVEEEMYYSMEVTADASESVFDINSTFDVSEQHRKKESKLKPASAHAHAEKVEDVNFSPKASESVIEINSTFEASQQNIEAEMSHTHSEQAEQINSTPKASESVIEINSTFEASQQNIETEISHTHGEKVKDVSFTPTASKSVVEINSTFEESQQNIEAEMSQTHSEQTYKVNATPKVSESAIEISSTFEASEQNIAAEISHSHGENVENVNFTPKASESVIEINSTFEASQQNIEAEISHTRSEQAEQINSTPKASESVIEINSTFEASEQNIETEISHTHGEKVKDVSFTPTASKSVVEINSTFEASQQNIEAEMSQTHSEQTYKVNATPKTSESVIEINSTFEASEQNIETEITHTHGEKVKDVSFTPTASKSVVEINSTFEASQQNIEAEMSQTHSEQPYKVNATPKTSESVIEINSTFEASDQIIETEISHTHGEKVDDVSFTPTASESIIENNSTFEASQQNIEAEVFQAHSGKFEDTSFTLKASESVIESNSTFEASDGHIEATKDRQMPIGGMSRLGSLDDSTFSSTSSPCVVKKSDMTILAETLDKVCIGVTDELGARSSFTSQRSSESSVLSHGNLMFNWENSIEFNANRPSTESNNGVLAENGSDCQSEIASIPEESKESVEQEDKKSQRSLTAEESEPRRKSLGEEFLKSETARDKSPKNSTNVSSDHVESWVVVKKPNLESNEQLSDSKKLLETDQNKTAETGELERPNQNTNFSLPVEHNKTLQTTGLKTHIEDMRAELENLAEMHVLGMEEVKNSPAKLIIEPDCELEASKNCEALSNVTLDRKQESDSDENNHASVKESVSVNGDVTLEADVSKRRLQMTTNLEYRKTEGHLNTTFEANKKPPVSKFTISVQEKRISLEMEKVQNTTTNSLINHNTVEDAEIESYVNNPLMGYQRSPLNKALEKDQENFDSEVKKAVSDGKQSIASNHQSETAPDAIIEPLTSELNNMAQLKELEKPEGGNNLAEHVHSMKFNKTLDDQETCSTSSLNATLECGQPKENRLLRRSDGYHKSPLNKTFEKDQESYGVESEVKKPVSEGKQSHDSNDGSETALNATDEPLTSEQNNLAESKELEKPEGGNNLAEHVHSMKLNKTLDDQETCSTSSLNATLECGQPKENRLLRRSDGYHKSPLNKTFEKDQESYGVESEVKKPVSEGKQSHDSNDGSETALNATDEPLTSEQNNLAESKELEKPEGGNNLAEHVHSMKLNKTLDDQETCSTSSLNATLECGQPKENRLLRRSDGYHKSPLNKTFEKDQESYGVESEVKKPVSEGKQSHDSNDGSETALNATDDPLTSEQNNLAESKELEKPEGGLNVSEHVPETCSSASLNATLEVRGNEFEEGIKCGQLEERDKKNESLDSQGKDPEGTKVQDPENQSGTELNATFDTCQPLVSELNNSAELKAEEGRDISKHVQSMERNETFDQLETRPSKSGSQLTQPEETNDCLVSKNRPEEDRNISQSVELNITPDKSKTRSPHQGNVTFERGLQGGSECEKDLYQELPAKAVEKLEVGEKDADKTFEDVHKKGLEVANRTNLENSAEKAKAQTLLSVDENIKTEDSLGSCSITRQNTTAEKTSSEIEVKINPKGDDSQKALHILASSLNETIDMEESAIAAEVIHSSDTSDEVVDSIGEDKSGCSTKDVLNKTIEKYSESKLEKITKGDSTSTSSVTKTSAIRVEGEATGGCVIDAVGPVKRKSDGPVSSHSIARPVPKRTIQGRPNIRSLRAQTQVILNPLVVRADTNSLSTEAQEETLRKELKSLQDQLEEMQKADMDKDKRILSYALHKEGNKNKILRYKEVLKHYENHISKQQYDMGSLRQKFEQVSRDFASGEMAFAELIAKYERAKEAIGGFMKNEEMLIENIRIVESQISEWEAKCEELRNKSEEKLKRAQDQAKQEKEQRHQKITTLRNKVRILEIKRSTLEVALKQKTEENLALAALCEDLIGKQTS